MTTPALLELAYVRRINREATELADQIADHLPELSDALTEPGFAAALVRVADERREAALLGYLATLTPCEAGELLTLMQNHSSERVHGPAMSLMDDGDVAEAVRASSDECEEAA